MNFQNKTSSKMETSYAIKKIMTTLYFILNEEPQRNNTFNSSKEMHEKLEVYFQRFVKTDRKGNIGDEILKHFTSAINEMVDMGIILYDTKDENSPVLIVKEKLIQQIAHI